MKAVWYERTGPAADVLTFGEMRTLIGGPGEVRVWLFNGQRNGRAFGTTKRSRDTCSTFALSRGFLGLAGRMAVR
jgi:hypothetical protein